MPDTINLKLASLRDGRKRPLEEDKYKATVEFQNSLFEVKKLSGFLPICASCKKIRDNKGYWKEVERCVSEHSEAEVIHRICRDCARKFYPELFHDQGDAPQVKCHFGSRRL